MSVLIFIYCNTDLVDHILDDMCLVHIYFSILWTLNCHDEVVLNISLVLYIQHKFINILNQSINFTLEGTSKYATFEKTSKQSAALTEDSSTAGFWKPMMRILFSS